MATVETCDALEAAIVEGWQKDAVLKTMPGPMTDWNGETGNIEWCRMTLIQAGQYLRGFVAQTDTYVDHEAFQFSAFCETKERAHQFKVAMENFFEKGIISIRKGILLYRQRQGSPRVFKNLGGNSQSGLDGGINENQWCASITYKFGVQKVRGDS